MQLNTKFLAIALVFTAATILLIAACATAFYTVATPGFTLRVGWIEACTTLAGSGAKSCTTAGLGCQDAEDTREAGAAFLIMSTIIAGLIALFAWLVAFRTKWLAGMWRFWFWFGVIVVAIFLLIAWPIGFALYSSSFCGIAASDVSGSRVGPAPPLALVAWILWLVGAAMLYFWGPWDTTLASTSSSSAPTSNNMASHPEAPTSTAPHVTPATHVVTA